MALLNLTKTDFILFATYYKSIKIITVDFVKEFAKDLLSSLKSSFFNMWHYLYKDKKMVEKVLKYFKSFISF